jgi:hypothetical protein
MGEKMNAYRIFVDKPEGKRRRWEDNMKINLRGMDWIDLAQDRDQWKVLVNTAMNLRAAQLAASQEGLRSHGVSYLTLQHSLQLSFSVPKSRFFAYPTFSQIGQIFAAFIFIDV